MVLFLKFQINIRRVFQGDLKIHPNKLVLVSTHKMSNNATHKIVASENLLFQMIKLKNNLLFI